MDKKTPYEVIVLGDPDDPSDCLRGLVQTILDYTAKQITTCLDIIAKEYGHSREDLADLLRNSKEFDMSLKKQLGLVIESKSKSGRKILIKKKQQQNLTQPAPSVKNSQ